VLGINTSPVNAEVQIGGMAWRVDVAPFCREVGGGTALRRRLDRYLYVLLTQRAQTAICAYFHVVEERLARWFLMTRDRAHSDEFHLTHEQMSGILGVRRAGITRAAIALQARSLIRYSRGEVRILDGEGLEAAACECYASDRRIYAHGLS
jgi:CRP-like cAMP-binding protein